MRLTYATGLVRPKTTALFFDKLWVPDNLFHPYMNSQIALLGIPPKIRIGNPRLVDQYAKGWVFNDSELLVTYPDAFREKYPYLELDIEIFRALSKVVFCDEELQEKYSKLTFRDDRSLQFDPIRAVTNTPSTFYRNQVLDRLVVAYAKEGIRIVPIYLDPGQYQPYIIEKEASHSGLEICLDFIPDIDEDNLTWDKVLDFRKDKKARKKLFRLRRWFNIKLLDKSEEEIKNILGQKLDDYEWALKKHGIQTLIGGCTSILTSLAAPGLISLISTSALSSVSGGLALAGGALAWIGMKRVERLEIQRQEVAYIYEAEKLTKTK